MTGIALLGAGRMGQVHAVAVAPTAPASRSYDTDTSVEPARSRLVELPTVYSPDLFYFTGINPSRGMF